MEYIKAKIEESVLHISIPVEEPLKKSKSGKTMILASTHGNQKIEIEGATFWLGLNCYTYPELLKSFRARTKKLSAKEQREVKKHNEKVSEKIANQTTV